MTEKELRELLNGYYEENERLDDELDVARKPTYEKFGLAIKESYLEYAQENAYDE